MSLIYAELSDGELAALTAAGRQPAFGEIVRRYRDPIYRLVRGCTGDPEEALDLTQDCFAAAFRTIGQFDHERSMRAWLATIALNRCRDWRRRQRIRSLFSFGSRPPDEVIDQVPDLRPAVDDAASDRRELIRVEEAILRLPANLRETLLLRTVEGLSQGETAQALGVTPKAVETRLHRARKQLAALLEERRR